METRKTKHPINTRNTKNKVAFVFDNFFWMILGWIYYKNLLFRCLPDRTATESRIIMWSIIAICFLTGILFEMKRYRNSYSIFTNLASGYGIYTVLAYLPIKKTQIIVTSFIVLILSIVYTLLILCRKIKNRRLFKRILARRILKAGQGIRSIICSGLVTIMLFISVTIVFGSLVKPSVKPSKNSETESQMIEDNIDTLTLLYEKSFNSLPYKKKIDVLQTIANIERISLNLPNELNVIADNLPEGQEGYYSDNEHKIVLNLDSLLTKSSYNLVDTITHEAFHSLQCRMVQAYDEASDDMKPLIIYKRASVYKNEFNNYCSGDKDICGYYFQQCEVDAREHAQYATNKYFCYIYDYLGLSTSELPKQITRYGK